MLDSLKRFPLQIKEAMQLPLPSLKIEGNIKNIVFCGMGGSAISGDILKHYLQDEINVPMTVVRDYNVPKFVNKNSLVFAVSYSGNTAETLSAFNDAKRKKAKIIAISSGGRLKRICRHLITIPGRMLPRDSLAYLFFPLLRTLAYYKLIKNKDKEIKETAALLKNFDAEKAKIIAQQIKGKIPVIYSSKKYAPLVYRLKTQINENSKDVAVAGVFSEINHNEIEARFDSRFAIILFQDLKEDKRMRKQIDLFKKIVPAKIHEINLKGKSRLAKMFYGIHFGDFLSYYLAESAKVDISKTERIDAVKRMLR